MKDVFMYISPEEYKKQCETIKSGQRMIIYDNGEVEIELKKSKKRIFTVVNTYGKKSLNEAINNICSLV